MNTNCESSIKLKNWKQFTTVNLLPRLPFPLWILNKIKELKAIHNVSNCVALVIKLWILNKIKELKAIHNDIDGVQTTGITVNPQ